MALGARKAQYCAWCCARSCAGRGRNGAGMFWERSIWQECSRRLTSIFYRRVQCRDWTIRAFLLGAPFLLGALAMLACYIPLARIGEDRSA